MTDSNWTLDPDIDAYLEAMPPPPAAVMEAFMAERMRQEAAAPKVGDVAPEFRLNLLGNGCPSSDYVSVADFRGRHLALLFGSYTCPVYRGQIERLNEIHAELSATMAFLFIYISEAHPEDGWQLDINHTQKVVYRQPDRTDARAAIAMDCVRRHTMQMQVALDDMNNSTSLRYSASPERLYLVDPEGGVQYRSAMGPFKMTEVERWAVALRAAQPYV